MARTSPTTTRVCQLVVVLGDQLAPTLSSLRQADPACDVVLMAEVGEETTYIRHHKKKIALVLSAMRHFAEELRTAGWQVEYVRLDDRKNGGSFTSEVVRHARALKPERIVVTEPGEWRVMEAIRGWEAATGVPVEVLPDDRFVCSVAEFNAWARGRKQLRMEHFYREMRRKTGLLMDGDQPAGGQWNFDHDNRKPAKRDLLMPRPPRFTPDETTRAVLDLVAACFASHFGDLEPFWFAVTRRDAEQARDAFLKHALPRFGDYQDAMLADERFLYHSVLSVYINIGLIDPLDVCRRAEAEWKNGRAPLNAVEGFIRQIIGWREYVRGVYWAQMPEYVTLNGLEATRDLPELYWTGETDMACMAAVVRQTREEAYAHHIQRLMVTGNFALLAGIDPAQVHEWYLAVYADAFEWVELPNTLGMSQHADGGYLASKPYAASGAYIDRMSDYCKGCRYDVKQRTGKDACPFNALYWDFLVRHRARFEGNPRMAQMYRTYDKLGADEHKKIKASAAAFLASLEPAAKGWVRE